MRAFHLHTFTGTSSPHDPTKFIVSTFQTWSASHITTDSNIDNIDPFCWEGSALPFTPSSCWFSTAQHHSHSLLHVFLHYCLCSNSNSSPYIKANSILLFELNWNSCNRILAILFIYFVSGCLLCHPPPQALLMYNWQIKLYKFKVYNMIDHFKANNLLQSQYCATTTVT